MRVNTPCGTIIIDYLQNNTLKSRDLLKLIRYKEIDPNDPFPDDPNRSFDYYMYLLPPELVPHGWSNDPEDVGSCFPHVLSKLCEFKDGFRLTKATPIVSLQQEYMTLFENKSGEFFLFSSIDGSIERVEEPKGLEEILGLLVYDEYGDGWLRGFEKLKTTEFDTGLWLD